MAFWLFLQLPIAGWWFWALLLAPDLSMAGYLAGPRSGAVLYNFFHHKGLGIALFITGCIGGIQALQTGGLILFAHSCMDRVFGYGLKYPDSFSNTHLGKIGKSRPNE